MEFDKAERGGPHVRLFGGACELLPHAAAKFIWRLVPRAAEPCHQLTMGAVPQLGGMDDDAADKAATSDGPGNGLNKSIHDGDGPADDQAVKNPLTGRRLMNGRRPSRWLV